MTDVPTSEEDRRLSNALQSWLPAFPVTDEEVEQIEALVGAERARDGDQSMDRVSARTMVRGLETALRERSHPFPAFASRIMALRMSSRNQEALETRFEISLDLWREFESGRIHPAWFSRAATLSGARTLPPIDAWRAAIRDACDAVRPEERAPDATALSRLLDPWVEYLDDLLRGEEVTTAAADAIRQTEFPRLGYSVGDRVRSRAHHETGVVLRRIAEDLFEVSLPQGTLMLPASDLEGLEASITELMVRKQVGGSRVFASFLQSQFLLHAYRYDELASLNNARVEPKPHQVFVAWRVLNKVRPRMILADEVGLGKTIEAGIILKELAARQLVTRVLIVVPANLVGQWVWEMKSKFNIDLEVYDGRRTRELRQRYQDRNIWEIHDQIICSLPFASRDSVAKEIAEAEWDMVVFDEAHRVRKRRQRTTKAYALADELRFGAYGMLLLTATPMQLDSSELFATIELVEPGLFPGGVEQFNAERRKVRDLNELMLLLNDYEGLSEVSRVARSRQHFSYLRGLLELGNPTPELIAERLADDKVRQSLEQRLIELHPLARVMVRNRKREVPEAFTRRKARSVPVPLSQEEAEIYERVEAYVRGGFNRAKADKNMAVGFLMVTFMKMLTSSSHSLARSFERRAKKLQADLTDAPQEPAAVRAPALVGSAGSPGGSKGWARWDSPNVVELREAAEQSEAVDQALEAITREAATRMEVDELRKLISDLDATPDTKLTVLSQFLDEIFARDSDEKVLIFTQFIETQLFLRDHLSSSYSVQIFNGRQSADGKDRSVKRFRERDQVLISTEAGGEGRNFQFAHIVVNYDLPWNPMKIEQRIGRVDRIGQKRDVLVQNFFLEHPDHDKSTLDERVFEVLQERINVFEESIGSLDPILGDVEEEIRRVALEAEPEEIEAEFRSLSENIEAQMKQARQMERRLRDFVMDKNSYRWDKARELMDQEKALATWRDLERFVSHFLQFHGGSVDEHSEGGQVVTIPLRFAHELRTRHSRQRGTFDPERALSFEELDFFAIGHPLVDRMLDFAAGRTGEARVAAYEETTQGSEGWAVELFYRVRATGVRPREIFIRHRVQDRSLVVNSRITSMPDAGPEVHHEDIPLTETEITDAVRVSEEAIVAAQATMQREMETRNAGQRAEEIERAQRIYQYRRQKEQQTIDEQQQRLSDYEHAGTTDERRLIPAIRGRIEKARQRLQVVELDHARELQEIEERSRVAVSYELLGGAFVWLRPR